MTTNKRRRRGHRGAGALRWKAGVWYIRWFDADGNRKEASTGTSNKAEAAAQLAAHVAAAAQERTGQRRRISGDATAAELLPAWLDGLTNRDAEGDRARALRYLVPKWNGEKMRDIDLPAVMRWLDELRREPPPTPKAHGRHPRRLSEPTLRHLLNLLSRFFAWCVERGYTDRNVVRDVPRQRRPHMSGRTDMPWLDDDAAVRQLVHALPPPVNLCFYLGNRSGLRTGELCGLRLSDLGFLADGAIRVRFSYGGPLKEDKTGEGKMKWAPAPADAAALLGPWLAARQAAGAGPEDLAFPAPEGGMLGREAIGRAWRVATGRRKALRHTTDTGTAADAPQARLTWYQATRHSFVSRNLSRGASLDEVSSSVGHSSPTVTRRFYDHYIRRTFSEGLRAGLGLTADTGPDAPVLPLRLPAPQPAAPAPAAAPAAPKRGSKRGKR